MTDTPGNDPVAAILAAIASIQRAMSPPIGADKIAYVADQLIVNPSAGFPVWMNVPRRGRLNVHDSGTLGSTEVIDMMLLVGKAESYYSSEAQRLWVPVVRNAFAKNVKLNGSVQIAQIVEWNYDPIEIAEVPYIGVTFTLECSVEDAFVFEP